MPNSAANPVQRTKGIDVVTKSDNPSPSLAESAPEEADTGMSFVGVNERLWRQYERDWGDD
jgi:hypothetical protein